MCSGCFHERICVLTGLTVRLHVVTSAVCVLHWLLLLNVWGFGMWMKMKFGAFQWPRCRFSECCVCAPLFPVENLDQTSPTFRSRLTRRPSTNSTEVCQENSCFQIFNCSLESDCVHQACWSNFAVFVSSSFLPPCPPHGADGWWCSCSCEESSCSDHQLGRSSAGQTLQVSVRLKAAHCPHLVTQGTEGNTQKHISGSQTVFLRSFLWSCDQFESQKQLQLLFVSVWQSEASPLHLLARWTRGCRQYPVSAEKKVSPDTPA